MFYSASWRPSPKIMLYTLKFPFTLNSQSSTKRILDIHKFYHFQATDSQVKLLRQTQIEFSEIRILRTATYYPMKYYESNNCGDSSLMGWLKLAKVSVSQTYRYCLKTADMRLNAIIQGYLSISYFKLNIPGETRLYYA